MTPLLIAALLSGLVLSLLLWRLKRSWFFVLPVLTAVVAGAVLLLVHRAWLLVILYTLFFAVFRNRFMVLYAVLERRLAGRRDHPWHQLPPLPGRYRFASHHYVVELHPQSRSINGHFLSSSSSSADTLTQQLVCLCQWPERQKNPLTLPELDIHTASTLLGLGREAGCREIVQSSRTLMSAYHPDRGGPPALAVAILSARNLLLSKCESADAVQADVE